MSFAKLYTTLVQVAREVTAGWSQGEKQFVRAFAPAIAAAVKDKGTYKITIKTGNKIKTGKGRRHQPIVKEVDAIGLVRHAAVANGQGANFSRLQYIRKFRKSTWRQYVKGAYPVSLQLEYRAARELSANGRKGVRVPRAVRARMKAFESFAARNGIKVAVTFSKLA